jgi:hypothetical protein
MEALILIPPNWQLEFHVHTNAFLFVVGAMLTHNPTCKYDQPIIYAFRLLNKAEQNYITTERKTLTMVYAFQLVYGLQVLITTKYVFPMTNFATSHDFAMTCI